MAETNKPKKRTKNTEAKKPKKTRKKGLLNLDMKERKFLALVVLFSLLFGAMGSVLGLNVYQEMLGGSGLKTVFLSEKNIKVEQSSAVIDTVAKMGPAVVSITSEQSNLDFFGQSSKSKSSGTGFIINPGGLIITNKHVVSDEDANYAVFTSDGKEYKATVVATDPLNDIAFIKINAKNLPIAELGDSDKLKVGEIVVAIGNALGQYQNTVTAGVVSAIGRAVPVSDGSGSDTLENVIQTDAAINPGNSGGPLVNLDGQVIGINTAIDSSGQSIGFAIPVNMVKNVIDSVEKSGKVLRPYIGIRYIPITKEFASRNDISVTNGLLVYGGSESSAIVSGSPASDAGLQEGDIILEIDGKVIDRTHSLAGVLQTHNPGDRVRLKVLRDGDEINITVKLGVTK